jgi:hypothetical protein
MLAKLRLPGDLQLNRLAVPTENTAEWEAGQLLSFENGYAVKLDDAAEDATFLGVSLDKRKLGDTFPDVGVQIKGIFEVPVTNGTYTIGEALGYNASTDVLESSSTNTIAWAWENKTGTSLKVLIDVPLLGKLFPVNA